MVLILFSKELFENEIILKWVSKMYLSLDHLMDQDLYIFY